MTRLTLLLVLSLSTLTGVACGKDKAADTTPAPAAEPAAAEPTAASTEPLTDAEAEALVGDMLAFMGKVADIFDAHKGDCPTLGTELQAFADANKPMIAELELRSKRMSPEQQQAAMESHKEHFEEVMVKLMGGAQACQNDEGVQKAMKSLEANE